jgi:hypothetical protein
VVFPPSIPTNIKEQSTTSARAHHRLERARADEVGSGEKEKKKKLFRLRQKKKIEFCFEGIFATRKTGKTHSPLAEKKPRAPKLPFSLFFLSL